MSIQREFFLRPIDPTNDFCSVTRTDLQFPLCKDKEFNLCIFIFLFCLSLSLLVVFIYSAYPWNARYICRPLLDRNLPGLLFFVR